MALHPNFPESPYSILDPPIRWFPADEALRESSMDKLTPPLVPQRRIGEIVAGKRAVTVDTGLRLSRFFGTSDGFWIGLQTDYDTAQAKDALSDVLSRIHRFEPVHA
jgi:addiction module HigA family antidote